MAEGTIVDALIVSLSLDPSGFERGSARANEALKRTRDQTQRDAMLMEEAGKRGAGYFEAMQKAAGNFLTLLGAADMAKFADKTVNAFNRMGLAAEAAGVKPQLFQAYELAFERMGGKADDAAASITTLARTFAQFKYRPGSLSTDQMIAFQAIGADAKDQPTDVLRKFFGFAQKHRDNPTEVALYGRNLGLSDDTAAIAMREGTAGFNRGMKDVSPLVMSDDQLAKMNRTREAVTAFLQALQSDANALVADLGPAMPVIDGLTKLMRAFPGATTGIMALLAFVTGVKGLKTVGGLVGLGGGSPAPKVLPKVAGAAEAVEGEGAAAAGGAGLTAANMAGPVAGAAAGSYVAAKGLKLETDLLAKSDDPNFDPYDINIFDENQRKHKEWLKTHKETWGKSLAHYTQAVQNWALGKLGGGRKGGGALAAARATPNPAPASHAVANSGMAALIARFFLSHGASPQATAGILAGMMAETGGLNPDAGNSLNGGKGAHYLGQWRGSRLDALRAMFPGDGAHITPEHQLEFMWGEMHGRGSARDYRAGMEALGARTAAEAMTDYLRDFMRPGAGPRGLGGDLSRGYPALARANQTVINISKIDVNAPHAKDADGIAHRIGEAIRRDGLVSMVNTGLS